MFSESTTVEITIGYLTCCRSYPDQIYNSRNYYRLLNYIITLRPLSIYNSRNYYRLLNDTTTNGKTESTTVEITIGYLTQYQIVLALLSTTVEITIGYLTCCRSYPDQIYNSRNYYRLLNKLLLNAEYIIYNSRNYYRLLNPIFVFLHNFLSCNHHI